MSPSVLLIGGGVRCGKSAFAIERALDAGDRRAFIATAQAFDDEMQTRIDAHILERGEQFTTVEEPLKLVETLQELAAEATPYDVVVVDCLTLWISNLMFIKEDEPALEAEARITQATHELRDCLASLPFSVIFVTNEVGLGIVPEHRLARRFRDYAGRLHQELAAKADEVFFGAMGLMLRLKPSFEAVTRNKTSP